MKTVLGLFVILAFASSAMALNTKQYFVFNNSSAASATVRTSAIYDTRQFKFKTVQVSGVTLASSPTSVTFKNMSGTLACQTTWDSVNGPWTPCVSNNYAQTVVSQTVNGIMTWTDVANYIKFVWTSGTKGGKLRAWLNLSE